MHIYVTSNWQKVETLMFYILRRGWGTANSTLGSLNWQKLSLVVRKPAFCICENKDAGVTAKLISAFVFTTRIVKFLYFLNPKFQASTIFCGCTAWFVSDLVENTEDRFSHNEAQLKLIQASQCLFLWHERVQSKITEKRWRHHFPYSMGIFFTCERAANSVVDGPIWPKFELIQDMHVLVTCKIEKDRINSN